MNIRVLLPIVASGALLMTAATAAPPPGRDTPQNTGDVIEGAVTQPLSDVNLKKKDIPPALLTVLANPYDTTGLRKCRQIIAAVAELDVVLGPDLDQTEVDAKGRKRRQAASSIAGGLVSSLIPFRFLVREISGAGKAERAYREAVFAGVVRRAFLKGMGQQRRCRAPGRPLTPDESARDAVLIAGGNENVE